ncbi:uncharacterized protein PG986_015159 [Apiospora aurea]|uniref:Heterokaryon incompatibility domain-containing protein n=1 Tax=Apiospora aurea TaxID=335848 RepID=A0ABR1PRS7_9PEZI
MLQDQADYSLTRLHSSHLLGITEALRVMLLSQWWSRMWVFQEVIVASRVDFQYAGVEAPLEMFTNAAASCLQDPNYAMPLKSDIAAVLHHYAKVLGDIAYWRGFWGEQQSTRHRSKSSELIALLRATAMRKASDDRDRVFALLGLFNLRTPLVPDYEQSTARVFMSVSWNSIQDTRTLEALCGDLGRKNRSDLPSWTADWSAIVHDGDKMRMKLLGKYKACGDQMATAILDTGRSLANLIEINQQLVGRLWIPSWAEAVFQTLEAWKPAWSRPLWESTGPSNIYGVILSLNSRLFDTFDTFCVQQDINLIYEQPSGGRLCGLARSVGTVDIVNEPLYEPIGPHAVVHTMEWIATHAGISQAAITDMRDLVFDMRGLVFDMKYVDGQYHRLEDLDLDSLSCWVAERIVHARNEGDHLKIEDDLGFDLVFRTLAIRRKVFRTTSGRVGWGPLDTQPGDDIYVLPGGNTPFVMRSASDEYGVKVHRLVGDCFLNGEMDYVFPPSTHWCPDPKHSVFPAVFWSECKNDLIKYFNESVKRAVNAAMETTPKQMRETMPVLQYIDKPGVFDAWMAEVLEWASTYQLANKLPLHLRDPESALCTAFRNLEKMPKPEGHITIV